jgi:Galactose oxidase, central domain
VAAAAAHAVAAGGRRRRVRAWKALRDGRRRPERARAECPRIRPGEAPLADDPRADSARASRRHCGSWTGLRGHRTAGFDTNLDLVEAYSPSTGRWATLPSVPGPRGGTGATSTGRDVVSAGGEANEGTIKEVYALDLDTNRWRRLPDLRTPRHGLGVVFANGRVYVVAGGPTPGLSASPANEFLPLR